MDFTQFGLPANPLDHKHAHIVLICIAVAAFVLIVGPVLNKAVIMKWCRQNGYQLVAWRGVKFYESPYALTNNTHTCVYHVTILDTDGKERRGWLRSGKVFIPFMQFVSFDVTWEDEMR